MKIFGLLGKKEGQPSGNNTLQAGLPSQQAQETSRKIDAIESEMSAEFRKNLSSGVSSVFLEEATPPTANSFPQLIEESAILFASGQTSAAKELLESLIQQTANTPLQEQLVWWMLFDLLQIEGMHTAFEQLALNYASHFETSPPQWHAHQPQFSADNSATHKLILRGKLTHDALPHIEKIRTAGSAQKTITLQFDAVTDVDAQGATALYDTLQHWQVHGSALSVHGAEALTALLRNFTQASDPQSCEGAWLLCIELLRLMNEPEAHDALCMQYSMVFEVSPPAFVAPPGARNSSTSPLFIMPAIVAAPVDILLDALSRHADTHAALIIDCTQLVRVEFTAVVPLLNGLSRLAEDKTVELHNTNFLVAVLLKLIGGERNLSIYTRKL